MLKLINRLVNIPTVSTREEVFLDMFLDIIEDYELYGKNILIRGKGNWFLVAHYDNIGFVLEDYLANGKYMYSTRGLVNIKEGLVRSIYNGEEIIGILKDNEIEILDFQEELNELYPFVYYGHVKDIGDRWVGPNLDNKLGVAVILDIRKYYDINILLLAGEEQGVTRLGRIAKEFKNSNFICIDGTSQYNPHDIRGIDKIMYRSIEGSGSRAPKELVDVISKYIQDEAQTYSEYQISDATTFYRYGMKAINISYPIKYLHSPNEIVYKNNVFKLRELLIKIIEDL